MRELKTEEFRFEGVRYTVAFQEVRKGHVLFHATAHKKKGYKPETVNAGKAHTKKEAMQMIMESLAKQRHPSKKGYLTKRNPETGEWYYEIQSKELQRY